MQTPLIIQWPEEAEDFIFASHTSLVGLEFILDKLIDTGNMPESLRGKSDVGTKGTGKNRKEYINRETGLRKMKMEQLDGNQTNFSRIKVESLDFDWIFEGKNASTMLKILNGLDDTSIFSRKSIQILI